MVFLYYAGMASDRINEQIGLAVSQDGSSFKRVNGDGLIIRRDPRLRWKDLRVCNPTVLYENKRFEMFYQGISSEPNNPISIGFATSKNGIDWVCDEDPILTSADLKTIDPAMDLTRRTGVFEPSVIRDKGVYKMWFMYTNTSQPGGSLMFAESCDGSTWTIHPHKVLSGSQFGPYRLHYPQVSATALGYELLFTLCNERNSTYGIFRMTSSDGIAWSGFQSLLPVQGDSINLQPRELLPTRWTGVDVPGAGFLNYRLIRWFCAPSNRYFGVAHPHRIEHHGLSWLYVHNYNSGPNDMWMDISRFGLVQGKPEISEEVLSPSPDPLAWDSFFVADPFVLNHDAL